MAGGPAPIGAIPLVGIELGRMGLGAVFLGEHSSSAWSKEGKAKGNNLFL